MALSTTHTFNLAIADDPASAAAGMVIPSLWNAANSHTLSGTASIGQGGTGLSTFNLGDTLYSSAANTLAALAGNITTTRKFLRQTGTGTVSAAPTWDTVIAADVPASALTSTNDTNVTITLGGTPASALLAAASLTMGWAGTLAPSRGGTGAASLGTSPQLLFNNSGAVASVSGSAVSALGDLAIGGATVPVSDPVLNLSQTWNAPTIATTSASGTGTVATIGFAAQAVAAAVGSTVVVAGVTPAGYNGTFTVTASTTSSVSYANTTTGAQTVAGTVQSVPIAIIANITDTSSSVDARIVSIQRAGVEQIGLDKFGNLLFPFGNHLTAVTADVFTINSYTSNGFNLGRTGVSTVGLYIGHLNSAGLNPTFGLSSNGQFSWSSGTAASSMTSIDTALQRVTTGVVGFSQGGGSTPAITGFYQWGGQSRVTADFSVTSSTTLTNVTGLSVNVAAGRTYKFTAEISWTDAAAGGIQAAISGTATATNIIYDGWIVDSAANGIKGNTQATALGTAVASAVTTGTAGHLTIEGTITVNAAGTLTVQIAQNTSNATATVAKRGSTFIVYDMP